LPITCDGRGAVARSEIRGCGGNCSRFPAIGADRNVTSHPASAISVAAWISGG